LQKRGGLGGAPHIVGKGRFVRVVPLIWGPTHMDKQRGFKPFCLFVIYIYGTHALCVSLGEKEEEKKNKKKEGVWHTGREREKEKEKEFV
jgi:hypothetical protein